MMPHMSSSSLGGGGGDGLSELVGHRVGLLDRGRLDHDAHQRFGAARPNQDAPLIAELARAEATLSEMRSWSPVTDPALTRTLRSTCGSRVITAARSRNVRPERLTASSSCTAVSNPSPVVARSGKITWPDCSPPIE